MQRELKQYSKAWYEKMQMIWRDRLDAMNIRKPKLYMDTSRIQEIKFIIPSLPRATNLAMQAYPNKRIGAHRKWCAPMFVWSKGVLKLPPCALSIDNPERCNIGWVQFRFVATG